MRAFRPRASRGAFQGFWSDWPDGRLTLTTVGLLAPHLTDENYETLLEAAERKSSFLEFDHVVPFAAGGPSTLENLELRCRAHNAYEAERAGLKLWRPEPTRSGPS
jgi:hypothetical protein